MLTNVDSCHFIVIFYFFSRFNPSTLNELRIGLRNNFFYLLYMGLSRFYDSGRKLDRLTWVFLFFFCWCFFQFYYSILDQLGIVLHIFFVCIIWDYLGFTTQITNFVSWLVWFLCHFFNFIIQHWVNWQLSFIFCFELHSLVWGWLRIRFNNFFYLFFFKLSGFHDLSSSFDRFIELIRVDLIIFLF
jgi:hypothetical protein